MNKLAETIARKYQQQKGLIGDRNKYQTIVTDNLKDKLPPSILRCVYSAITKYYTQDIMTLSDQIELLESLREE